jgi:hypothetical protein
LLRRLDEAFGGKWLSGNWKEPSFRCSDAEKREVGLKPEQSSCHTGQIAGYVVEGHVPAREIRRLLSERPDAVGLTVPDMPLGSPGMESGDDRDPYDVLLVRRDGTTEVFASYR